MSDKQFEEYVKVYLDVYLSSEDNEKRLDCLDKIKEFVDYKRSQILEKVGK